MPAVYAEFVRIANQLERHYKDVQDLEFTIERGKLYMLQTRSAKRTAAAAVKIAVDMVGEGLIDKREAVGRIEPAQVDQLLRDQFDPIARKAAKQIAEAASTRPPAPPSGAPSSTADVAVEWVARGETVVLVRVETSPDDFHGMAVAQGILTARGGATSTRPSSPARSASPASPAAPSSLVDDDAKTAHSTVTGVEIAEGDWISVDGSTGEACRACRRLAATRSRPSSRPSSAGPTASGAWASGRTPTSPRRPSRPARTARRASASAGPSTCSARASAWRSSGPRSSSPAGDPVQGQGRGGHELTADEAAVVAEFDARMGELEALQQGDFEGIFRAMDGLPVVVRLIDPPLHEFLPNRDDLIEEVTRYDATGTPADDPPTPRRAGCSPRQRRCASRTRCSASRLPPRDHDPGLREDPDPGHPQRPGGGQEDRRQPDRRS